MSAKDIEVGGRICKLRLEKKMSQEELAHKVGYTSKTTINKIELGKNALKISSLEKIAVALETTPSYLMGWLDEDDNLTGHEREVINAYRSHPDAQPHVDKLLDIEPAQNKKRRA